MKEVLYHYTNAAGFLGILESRTIWATHTSFLNDMDEKEIALRLYREVLEDLKSDKSQTADIKDFAGYALQMYGHIPAPGPQPLASLVGLHPRDYFVTCFSEKEDDLSQWRGYSGMGSKYAIGFKTEELRKLEQQLGAKLAPVRYGKAAVMKDIRERFLSRAAEFQKQIDNGSHNISRLRDLYPPLMMDVNHDLISLISPLTKNESFSAETECRLYFPSTLQEINKSALRICFRPGSNSLIPFLKIPLNDLSEMIASVTVGPTPHMEDAVGAAKLLTASASDNGMPYFAGNRPTIEASSIPFRDW